MKSLKWILKIDFFRTFNLNLGKGKSIIFRQTEIYRILQSATTFIFILKKKLKIVPSILARAEESSVCFSCSLDFSTFQNHNLRLIVVFIFNNCFGGTVYTV